MDINAWTLLGLSNTFLIYLTSACAVGGTFAIQLLQQHVELLSVIRRYLYLVCVLGIFFSVVDFFIQVGDFAGQTWAGMFDRDIANVLLQTPVANAIALRIGGFVLLTVSALYGQRKDRGRLPAFLVLLQSVVGALCVAFAFALVGHLNDQGVLAQLAISVHILAVSLWMGTLYPLWRVSRGKDIPAIQHSMKRFGELAAYIVATLLVCGVMMASILLEQLTDLFTTDYGRGLLLKILLVCALLLLAAGNKWWLVPNLARSGMQSRLTAMISLEMGLGMLVLLFTAALTTLTGP